MTSQSTDCSYRVCIKFIYRTYVYGGLNCVGVGTLYLERKGKFNSVRLFPSILLDTENRI